MYLERKLYTSIQVAYSRCILRVRHVHNRLNFGLINLDSLVSEEMMHERDLVCLVDKLVRIEDNVQFLTVFQEGIHCLIMILHGICSHLMIATDEDIISDDMLGRSLSAACTCFWKISEDTLRPKGRRRNL